MCHSKTSQYLHWNNVPFWLSFFSLKYLIHPFNVRNEIMMKWNGDFIDPKPCLLRRGQKNKQRRRKRTWANVQQCWYCDQGVVSDSLNIYLRLRRILNSPSLRITCERRVPEAPFSSRATAHSVCCKHSPKSIWSLDLMHAAKIPLPAGKKCSVCNVIKGSHLELCYSCGLWLYQSMKGLVQNLQQQNSWEQMNFLPLWCLAGPLLVS